MLSSVIVEHLEDQYPDIPIASIFCDSSNASVFTEEDLLRSILRQFFEKQSDIPNEVRRAFAQRRESEKHASPDVVDAALNGFLEENGRAYIVVDAFDEFGKDTFVREDGLATLLRLLDHKQLKMIITSVTGTINLDSVPQQVELEVEAKDDDLKEYLKVVLQKRRENAGLIQDLMGKIIERIIVVAEGVYVDLGCCSFTLADQIIVS